MASRAIWSGAINFGLVSVPVKMYTAVKPKDIAFHQVDEKTGSRIRYKRVSEKTGREVPYEQIAKGYEVGDDEYVVIEPKELEELTPEATHTIDIEDFVELPQIDPIYYEHTYLLSPDTGGDKAYTLLLKAMQDADMVAIGRVVIRTKQYLAAIRPYDRALALETMYYPDEVVGLSSVPGLPKNQRVTEREMKMARQLIDSLSTDFDPDKYHDEYRRRVESLIKKKAKGETITIHEEARETPKVVDLIEALKASVEQSGGSKRKSTKSRSSSRSRKSA
ncbi:MAG TPA: Ku protein [Actinomycetota bacterium]|nr:Ku protein [Actinomycetota bacterium]